MNLFEDSVSLLNTITYTIMLFFIKSSFEKIYHAKLFKSYIY